jgi:hypothetical protein
LISVGLNQIVSETRIVPMRKSDFDAQHYRARADECRTKAQLSYDAPTRDRMFKLAVSYERVADRTDELGGTDTSGESVTRKSQ